MMWMFLCVSVPWFYAEVHWAALLRNRKKIRTDLCDTSVDMSPGPTLSKSSLLPERIRCLVHFCHFLRVQNHESQHQKRFQYNWCTGLDVPKLAPIQQSREAHPCLPHVSHLLGLLRYLKNNCVADAPQKVLIVSAHSLIISTQVC